MKEGKDKTVNELLESIKEIDPSKLCSLILALADNDSDQLQTQSKNGNNSTDS